jgi:hypothetical protein
MRTFKMKKLVVTEVPLDDLISGLREAFADDYPPDDNKFRVGDIVDVGQVRIDGKPLTDDEGEGISIGYVIEVAGDETLLVSALDSKGEPYEPDIWLPFKELTLLDRAS